MSQLSQSCDTSLAKCRKQFLFCDTFLKSFVIFTGLNAWCFCAFFWVRVSYECMQRLVAELWILRLCGTHEHEPVQSWNGQGDFGNFHQFLNEKLTRSFFKLKKNMVKSCFGCCHRRHTLRNRVETIGRRPRYAL